jgi:uncharacterized integral membrane protein
LQRILRWIIGLPIALVVIGFAIVNRQNVTLSLGPLQPLSLPLWLLFFVGIFVGVIVGWFTCWLAQGKHRKRARDAQAEISRLQQERESLLQKVEPEPQANIVPVGTGWI